MRIPLLGLKQMRRWGLELSPIGPNCIDHDRHFGGHRSQEGDGVGGAKRACRGQPTILALKIGMA